MIHYYLSPFTFGLVEPVDENAAIIILPTHRDQKIGEVAEFILQSYTFKPISSASPLMRREIVYAILCWRV